MVIRSVISLALALALGGCSYAPGINITDQAMGYDPKKAVKEPMPPGVTQITPELIAQLRRVEYSTKSAPTQAAQAVQSYQYHIGINDVLSIIVWDHPELTIPAGEFRSAEAAGHVVGADGNIFFPYIGKIPVVGRTVGAIRYELTQKLSDYIKDPQLDVRIAGYRSQRISVTGQINKPGIIPLTDVPLKLVEAVNHAGGVAEAADLTRVILVRDGATYHFNMYDMLENGNLSENHILKHGDIVHIPDKLDNKIFVIGEVKQQTSHLMHKARMTLADALGASGGANQSSSDAQRIYVIRAAQTGLEPEVFHLNASDPTALLLSTRFQLKPLDVVYVSTSGLTRWNRVLSQILPTVQGLFQFDNVINR